MNTLLAQSTPNSDWSNLPSFIANPNPEIYLTSNNYVCLDYETTSIEKGDAGIDANRLLVAVWLEPDLDRPGKYRTEVQWGGEFGQGKLAARIQSCDFIICHNAKFELKWLHRVGVDLRRVLPYCTQIGEYVLAGNRKFSGGLGLDATAHRYGLGGKTPLAALLIKAGYPVEDIPQKDLEEYCKKDVELTHEIYLKQRIALKGAGLLRVAYGRNIVTPALADIEYKGTRLDSGRVLTTFSDVSKRYAESAATLDRISGGINFRSSKQVRAYVYDKLGFKELLDFRGNPVRTDGNQRSTNKDIIARLEAKTPEQKVFKEALLAVMPLKKKIQILEQMVRCCEKDEGKVYANFHQTVASTHRLSSTGGKWGFQFHNFPREFKPLFRARRDGWLICEADAPQLEFRVAIDLGNDERGRRDIQEGMDIHDFSATTVGVDRQTAKAFTFRPLYGGNAGTPRQRAYFKAFRKRYASLYETQSRWTYEVLGSKELTLVNGLKFYWPDTEIDARGYIKNREAIFNYPIQSLATADIIPLTLTLVWHYVKGMEVKIVNTVHDSIIADVLPKEVERYKEILRGAFTQDVIVLLSKLYGYEFKTPLGVTTKVGTHWGEGTEEKYEVFEND